MVLSNEDFVFLGDVFQSFGIFFLMVFHLRRPIILLTGLDCTDCGQTVPFNP